MKRKLAAGFLAAFTAATLMLGGCGKSEDGASDQAKATSEAGSGEQTDFSDIFWNEERLSHLIRKVDAVTVATGLVHLPTLADKQGKN